MYAIFGLISFYIWGLGYAIADGLFPRLSVVTITLSLGNLVGTYIKNIRIVEIHDDDRTTSLVGLAHFTYKKWEIGRFVCLFLTNMSCLIYLRMRNLAQ